jgi:hypothetical protein
MRTAESYPARLPRRPRGRPNGAAEEQYQADHVAFCDRILEIQSRLDFEVGSRGWCYLLEGEHIITKGQFDDAERLIARRRKDGQSADRYLRRGQQARR